MIATLGSRRHPLTALALEDAAEAIHEYFRGEHSRWSDEVEGVRRAYRGAALAALTAAEQAEFGVGRWQRVKDWWAGFVQRHIIADYPWEE